jgi:hypothetical protein
MGKTVITLEAHRNTARKATHLVDEYNALDKKVLCDCGWFGNEEDFQPHRKDMGAQKKQRLAANKLELEAAG